MTHDYDTMMAALEEAKSILRAMLDNQTCDGESTRDEIRRKHAKYVMADPDFREANLSKLQSAVRATASVWAYEQWEILNDGLRRNLVRWLFCEAMHGTPAQQPKGQTPEGANLVARKRCTYCDGNQVVLGGAGYLITCQRCKGSGCEPK